MRFALKSAMAFAAMFGVSHQAAAQDVSTDRPEGEVIVVTVQKRAQELLDVPMAVAAYDERFFERLGIQKFDELALFVPGLQVQEQSPNNPGFVIRGITSDSGASNEEARVAVFQDGVSISKSRGSYVELFDLERVEVARGPQPTLFGRGALIGGINLIQNKADVDQAYGHVLIGGGDYGQFRAQQVVNVPLAEGVAGLRIAATHRQRDGYVDNTEGGPELNGVETTAGRVSLRWDPSNAVRFDLIGNIQHDKTTGTSFESGTFAPAGVTTSPFDGGGFTRSVQGFEGGKELGLTRHVGGVTLLGEWRINDTWSLNSISGWRYFESLEMVDVDGTEAVILHGAEEAKGRQWSQEVRLNFDSGDKLAGFVGASYFTDSGSQRSPAAYDERQALYLAAGVSQQFPSVPAGFNPAVTQQVFNGLLQQLVQPQVFGLVYQQAYAAAIANNAPPNVADQIATASANQVAAGTLQVMAPLAGALKPLHIDESKNYGETDSIDIFADASYQITDRLELSGGLRWTKDEKVARLGASNGNGSSVLGAALDPNFIGLVAGALATGQNQAAVGLVNAAAAGQAPTNPGLFQQPIVGEVRRKGEFDDVTWRLAARYAVADNASLWASYARGRRPDVLALAVGNLPGSTFNFEVTPAEKVDAYEVGAKTSLMDGALNFEASVFQYEYTDFQTEQLVGSSLVTINAGEASATGFELAVDGRLGDRVSAFVNYAYNDAQFDTGAFKGNRFRLTPENAASVGVTLTQPIFGGALVLTPSYTWQSEVFFDDDNDRSDLQVNQIIAAFSDLTVDEKQEAYGLLNLRLGYEPTDGRWSVTLYGNNLTDEEYLIDAGNTGDSLGTATFIRGAPRMVGIEARTHF